MTLHDTAARTPKVRLRILFFPREKFPTDRVRLTTLFGRELLGRGHEIDLVMQAADPSVVKGPNAWFGRTVFVGPTHRGTGPIAGLWRNGLAVFHDLRRLFGRGWRKYDSVLISDKYFLGAAACLLAKARGQRVLFWLTYPYHHAQTALARDGVTRHRAIAALRGRLTTLLLHHVIVRRCDHLFVQSEFMAAEFAAAGVARSRMTVIVTGIDLEGVAPVQVGRKSLLGKPVTVGYLGTLVRQRRPELMVDVLHELRSRGIDARLLLVGDGASHQDRAVIERHAQDLALSPYVEITGFLPRKMALERIKAADICVSPFRPSPALDVASPTKLIEYMALGMPVVANAHPDQTIVLKESRAGVCVPWGARHFARGIRWLLQRQDDELTAMTQRGRKWVEQHRQYSQIADLFENACWKLADKN